MFRTKQNISVLVLWAIAALLGVPLVAASDSPGVMEAQLLAQITPDRVPKKVRPARPDLPPISPQRDAPRFFCEVNVSDFDPLLMAYESGGTFDFTLDWDNVSSVVADEVEVTIRFWSWEPGLQSWSPYSDSPVISHEYTNVGTEPGYAGRRLSREIKLEKDFHGRCYALDGEPHWVRCKYRVTQQIRYRTGGDGQPVLAPPGGSGAATNDWITGAECDKVIEWDHTSWGDEYQRWLLFENYPGGDYRDFAISKADPAICLSACVSDARCEYWTYVRPNHGQGPQAHCWLKDDRASYGVRDKCCMSSDKFCSQDPSACSFR